MKEKPQDTVDLRLVNMVRDNPDLLITKHGVEMTQEQHDEYREQMLYTMSVVANIRARLDKFGECLIDTVDLERIWKDEAKSAIVPDNANFRYRCRHMAKELDATVDWPNATETRFIKNKHVIEVFPAATLH